MSSKPTQALAGPLDHTVCALYTPGHQVHFIQARLAREEDPANYRTGTLVSVGDDGWITVEVDGEALRFWNHAPERARRCFEASEGRVGLPGRGLLHSPHAESRGCICVSTDGPTSCAPPPPAGASVVERIKSHGGVLLPGPEIGRILEEVGDTNGRNGA